MRPRCTSMIPVVAAGQPADRRLWAMCRRPVAARGRRCDECWSRLAGHPLLAIRSLVAGELVAGLGVDDPGSEAVWGVLSVDQDPFLRAALVCRHAPTPVIESMMADCDQVIADAAAEEMTRRGFEF